MASRGCRAASLAVRAQAEPRGTMATSALADCTGFRICAQPRRCQQRAALFSSESTCCQVHEAGSDVTSCWRSYTPTPTTTEWLRLGDALQMVAGSTRRTVTSQPSSAGSRRRPHARHGQHSSLHSLSSHAGGRQARLAPHGLPVHADGAPQVRAVRHQALRQAHCGGGSCSAGAPAGCPPRPAAPARPAQPQHRKLLSCCAGLVSSSPSSARTAGPDSAPQLPPAALLSCNRDAVPFEEVVPFVRF